MQSPHPTTEELSALLDGELPAAEADAIRRHLDTCAACRADLEALRGTIAMLRVLPAAAPPRSFRVFDAPKPGGLLAFPLARLASPVALRALAGVAAALMVVLFVADAARIDAPRADTGAADLRAPPGSPAAGEARPDQATRQAPPALAPQRAPSSAGGPAAGASSAADSVQALPSPEGATEAPQPPPGFAAPAETAGDRAVVVTAQARQIETRESTPAAPSGLPPARIAALALALLAVSALVVSFVARRPT